MRTMASMCSPVVQACGSNGCVKAQAASCLSLSRAAGVIHFWLKAKRSAGVTSAPGDTSTGCAPANRAPPAARRHAAIRTPFISERIAGNVQGRGRAMAPERKKARGRRPRALGERRGSVAVGMEAALDLELLARPAFRHLVVGGHL